ncbi:hypothetical protein KIPB_012284, partial [Kipferlia bialata]
LAFSPNMSDVTLNVLKTCVRKAPFGFVEKSDIPTILTGIVGGIHVQVPKAEEVEKVLEVLCSQMVLTHFKGTSLHPYRGDNQLNQALQNVSTILPSQYETAMTRGCYYPGPAVMANHALLS